MAGVILPHTLPSQALKAQASSPGAGIMSEVEKPQSLKFWTETPRVCGGSERWRAQHGWPADAQVSPVC